MKYKGVLFYHFPQNGCCEACGLSCEEMVTGILAGNRSRDDCKFDREQSLLLKIDGKEIKIVPFVQNTFKDVILGFVKNLKGYKKGKIEIEIDE